MSTGVLIAIAIVVIIVVAIVAYLVSQRRRSEDLRRRMGPEYDRTVREYGDRGRAEAVLQAREGRVKSLNLHPVSEGDREQFIQEWRSIETRFVDDPAGAVAQADRLVSNVMQARGYPPSDFEQRVADLSVNYPNLVGDYRATHDLAVRTQRGETTTEELRKAVVSYRNLFEELVGIRGTQSQEQRKAA